MRPLLIVLFTLLAWLTPASTANAAATGRVESVTYDAARGTLVIHGDTAVVPIVTWLDAPTRLVVDLPGTRLSRPGHSLGPIPGTPIKRVRMGQYLADTTRVVLELSSRASYQAIASGLDVLIPVTPGTANGVTPGTSTIGRPASGGQGPVDGRPELQAVVFHKGDLIVALSQRVPYWTHTVPGVPFRYTVVFPRTRAVRGLTGGFHGVSAYGVQRWRATQVGEDARLDIDLEREPRFTVEPSRRGWHFYVGARPRAIAHEPAHEAAHPTPKPAAPPAALTPAWRGAPDAPLALRKSGDQWQLMLSADGPFTYQTTAVGDDRLRVDITGARVGLPRDSVYIDGGLIARVRVTPEAGGLTRLTIDLDQPVRHSARMQPNQRSLLLTLSRLGKQRVTVDPGHGGGDDGTVGTKGVREKDVTLAIATRLARVMSAGGMSVQMTRMKDLEILLRPRVEMANHNDSDVFISIHANSFGAQHGVSGIETYYFNDESYELARAVHKHLLRQLNRPDRGVRKNNFYVVHHTEMPAALIEIGYLSNPEEETLLASPAYQEKAARAIYQGIQEFLAKRRQRS